MAIVPLRAKATLASPAESAAGAVQTGCAAPRVGSMGTIAARSPISAVALSPPSPQTSEVKVPA